MARMAAQRGLAISQKNAIDILPAVQDVVQFAVNEACGEWGQCGEYSPFVQTKPVFHVEYLSALRPTRKTKRLIGSVAQGCAVAIPGMSTIIKTLILDGSIQFCNGTVMWTATT
jgi:hypothetical protein